MQGSPAPSAATTPLSEAKTWILGGLVLVIVGGIVGTFFDQGTDGAAFFYSLAGIGGMAAGPLLAVRHLRAGRELAAAGFAAISIVLGAEAVAGYTGAGADSVLVSMSILHLPGLWLIASQEWSPVWARGAAAISGLAFAIWGYIYTLGDDVPDPEHWLLFVAWPLFIVAVVGWAMTVRDEA